MTNGKWPQYENQIISELNQKKNTFLKKNYTLLFVLILMYSSTLLHILSKSYNFTERNLFAGMDLRKRKNNNIFFAK